jgi:trk system potassium uptake protein
MELFDRITGARRLSSHSRIVLVLAAGFYLAGFVALGVLDEARATHGSPGGVPGAGWRESVGLSSATAVNARSAGMPFEFAAAFTRPAQWVLIALMIVGGAPGSAAGGLKTTTVWRIVAGVRDNLRGRHDAHRPFAIAACWAAIYFAIVLGGLLLLLHSEPDMPADRLLFLSVSAVSNVGLSHDPVSITGDGLFTLSAMMLLGRLVPLAVLWWMVRSNDGETIAVG